MKPTVIMEVAPMVDVGSNTDEQFAQFLERSVKPLTAELEERRKHYLKHFMLFSALSLGLFIAFTIYHNEFRRSLANILLWLNTISGVEPSATLEVFALFLLYAALLIFSIGIATLPIRRYRRHVKQVKLNDVVLGEQVYCLKEQAFSRLFQFFGDFSLNSEHRLSLLNLHGNRILPDHDQLHSEDRITGTIHDSKVEIAEAKLLAGYKGGNVAVFSGLLVIIDVCNPDVRLRGGFQGETVLIQDGRKHQDFITQKYSGFERVDLPDAQLEAQYELLSTKPEEARRLVQTDFIAKIEELANIIARTKEQVTHNDSRVLNTIGVRAQFVGEWLYSWFAAIPLSLLNLVKGGGLHLVRYHRPVAYDPLKHAKIYKEAHGVGGEAELEQLNVGIECNFYKDKLLITIPYTHDLFEPNSLFEPALVEEDMQLVYHIIKAVDAVTAHIVAAK